MSCSTGMIDSDQTRAATITHSSVLLEDSAPTAFVSLGMCFQPITPWFPSWQPPVPRRQGKVVPTALEADPGVRHTGDSSLGQEVWASG